MLKISFIIVDARPYSNLTSVTFRLATNHKYIQMMTLVDLFFSVKHQLHPFLLKSDGFRHPKGDLAERFSSRVTVFIFCLITAFCVTHFFWGKGQISCWLEHQDINEQWHQFINDYCYVQGTFFIPPDEPLPWKRDVHDRIYINYYQWVRNIEKILQN